VTWQYFNPQFEYEKIFPDLDLPWAGHKYFAYDLIRNIKPKIIVELGTHKGTSFFSMCQAVKDGHLKTKLYAIDTWKGDKHAGYYDESVFLEVNKIKDTYYKQLNIKLIRKYFDDALRDFKGKSIDILHIDGLHTYEAVKHDFDNWFGKVRSNGIIMLHDTCEKREDFGVYKLWAELKRKYKTLDFFHSHGLGILFKKNTSSIKIFDFQEIWQKYYNIIFENNIKNNQILIQLSQISQKISENQNLQNQLNQKTQENKSFQNKLNQISQENKSLKQQLSKITSSKTYKLWQEYCKIRDKILEKILKKKNEN